MLSDSDCRRNFAREAYYGLDFIWLVGDYGSGLYHWPLTSAPIPESCICVLSGYCCRQHLCTLYKKISSKAVWVGGLVLPWPVVGHGD